ncbi:phospholipase A I isoform X2 [Malania oleifera]|uniref:phospholipase A I isoform X2 n=1 Tax=Malania oleifera TaxID=397392 RepID=UPI0025AE44EE|nr:phospholipase A I isoform X2 [Malania oleifera]
MSWGLGWKRPSEIFHLTLNYGTEEAAVAEDDNRASSSSLSSSSEPSQDQDLGFRIELDWSAGDDEEQVALRLQSQLMVALPLPQDTVVLEMRAVEEEGGNVGVDMKVVKRREPLRSVAMSKAVGSGQQSDGIGVLTRLIRSSLTPPASAVVDGVSSCGEHWKSVTVVNLCGCGLSVLPVELTRLPLLEKLYLDNNKLTLLPPELGELKNLKVFSVDNNMLVSVPVELRQCIELVELSLEHNKLVRPLLDFRAMAELRILRLFGNPLEFLPEILPLQKLRHLSLANIKIVADENLRSVNVQIEMENSSYFVASRHKLSAFFSLIFRFSSCHHPLLASALAKIMQDQGNRVAVGKDENALRQLISMISSDNRHVVEQACSALSSLAADVSVAMQLMKSDIMQPIERVLKSTGPEELVSVLQVVVNLSFASDSVAQKMLTKDVLRSLKLLCAHKNPEVQRLALLAIGNLAFCMENRHTLVTSESLRDLLLRLTIVPEPCVYKAAARALAILGENENLRRAIRGRQVAKQGLRILSMDGGGMKGLATVRILKEIEKRTGKRIHEMFDLICGTSTGGMLAVALAIKLMTLDQCEEIYKKLGKLVFAEPVPKDNEAATWREKLDQLYKSSSQSFRVVVHGSKHSADQFERLLKEMCADEDGDLLIESAVKSIPKVFVVSTLVSMMPAQPFLFRNYQYPAGTPELPFAHSDSSAVSGLGTATTGAQVGYKHSAFIGSCKHHIWQAIRASSAAPYYLDDFSDGVSLCFPTATLAEVHRWQDGAIVANNPTIFAIREAQLLWPDTRIDCLVSIGCGSVPAKARKGGWRYLDTGQVLIESACSVERAEEALSTLLPMLPEIHYFRFNPVDERCDMELDETDPVGWMKLESATEEYIQYNPQAFKNACERLLLPYQHDEKWSENLKSHQFPTAKASNSENNPSLGRRRNVLLVEASNNPNSGRLVHHARSLETFCARNGIRLSLLNGLPGSLKTVPATTFPTPFTSPLFTGSFPSSPLLYSPDFGTQRIGRIDLVPPLSLDGFQSGKTDASSPRSPSGPRQLSSPVRSLHEKLQSSPQVGIIHLALQNDSLGLIISWQNDVFVVAEPGELADKFLQSVKFNMLSTTRGRRRKDASTITNISTVADLVAYRPYFQIGGVVHRYIGRQTQVMEDDREIGAYMFRRTVPSVHLTPDDVRWMIGAWRDRIIICTGIYGPTPTLIKAFLDSGAKAVISPSAEPSEVQMGIFHGSGEFNVFENGKFEIGEEEAEDEEVEPVSPVSDWEDSDAEKSGEHPMGFWDDDEEELSQFVCQFYDTLFWEGVSVDVALRNALASHRRLRYSCHLPGMP